MSHWDDLYTNKADPNRAHELGLNITVNLTRALALQQPSKYRKDILYALTLNSLLMWQFLRQDRGVFAMI